MSGFKDLTENKEKVALDEISPEQLDDVAGGISVDDAEEEECGTFICGSFTEKLR